MEEGIQNASLNLVSLLLIEDADDEPCTQNFTVLVTTVSGSATGERKLVDGAKNTTIIILF